MFDPERIKQLVSQLEDLSSHSKNEFGPDAEKVLQATSRVHESWSGSSLGHHAEIYFENFERPTHRFSSEWGTVNGMPRGWTYKATDDVIAEISRQCGIDLASWNEKWDLTLQNLGDLRNDIVVEFSQLDEGEQSQCSAMLAEIEKLRIDGSVGKKIAADSLNAHRHRMSRDLRAASAGGVKMPAQIYYDAVANEILVIPGYANDIAKLTKRALRCLELAELQRHIPISQGVLESMRDIAKDPFTLIKKNDGRKVYFKGLLTDGKLITFDSGLPCEDNDVVERALPGGRIESYLILDTGFQPRFHSIGDHFQMKVRKEGLQQAGDGIKNVTNIYNLSGHSSRVNLHAVDSSSNVVQIGELELFQKIRQAIRDGVEDAPQQQLLLERLEQLETAKGTSQFAERFQSFVAVASNCMTILTPFLPAPATMITS